ncbi:Flagellar protein FlaG [Candidatus Syntrophocurvum alkaliphilum]|uniref:Flagellar protein FlaG n=1 Tax=Candidatus Syntrophocurvum alkaliphilum TaxID=2293317 RepID=A0A6I6DN20_9FIRM|nr:flagellar protein FlaG [Candidatus Syntrophocurvum alkaliphilum]QGU00398.1 Flagellar protein FlaG [Candidatus Syntrophocurvum alkaliphilum]
MRVEGQGKAFDNPIKKEVKMNNKSENKSIADKTKDSTSKLEPTLDNLTKATDKLNKAFKISDYNIKFNVHEESERIHVKMIDSMTEEIIREIPPEKLLDFAAHIQEILDDAVGFLVDEIV